MTRKDYIAVAEIIEKRGHRMARPSRSHDVLRSVANDLADWFARDNPRFDRERFLTACKLD